MILWSFRLSVSCATACKRRVSKSKEVHDPLRTGGAVVVGEVLSVVSHAKADRLSVCEVSDGSERFRVVCGAPNVAQGQKVALARVGTKLPEFEIAKRKIRGVESAGMLCSRSELGLTVHQSEGIWVLPDTLSVGKGVLEQTGVQPSLTLGITPNRPDLLSHLGVAREIAAFSQQRLRAPAPRVTEKDAAVTSLARIVVDEPERCRRYVARIVRGLSVGPSPEWLRDRLERVGQRSVNNVVDITNYILFEYGQPLHAFDLKELAVHEGLATVRVRLAKEGERMTTLDGVERALDPDDLLIADHQRVLALAGVMGGADSEVNEGTTEVLIESAYFEPRGVRRASRRHGLMSESSRRFERGADPMMPARAADRCAQLMVDLAGGLVCKGRVEVANKADIPPEITLRMERVPRLLGIELSAEAVVQGLEPLDIRCSVRTDEILRFKPPSFRPDLTREVDLIEEVARRHGYDRIPERLPDGSGAFSYEAPPARPREIARQALLGAGCSECITFGFGSPSRSEWFAEAGDRAPVVLLNPLGEEFSAMRTSLVPGLLDVLARNQRQGLTSARFFEIGTTFHQRQSDGRENEDERDRHLPREVTRIAWAVYGGRHGGRWYEQNQSVDFSDLTGVLENLLEAFDPRELLDLRPVAVGREGSGEEHEILQLNPYASAEVYVGTELLGIAGELHPKFVDRLEMQGPVFVAELSLEALDALERRTIQHQSLARFPGTRRDLAVIAPPELHAETLRRFLMEHAGGAMGSGVISAVRIFDVYRGKNIPEHHTSIAFALDYRSPERTLTDMEVGEAFNGVIEALKKTFAVEIR